MRVQRLRISQVLGIDELEIEPGSITVAEGPNGAGKSSLIEALRAVIGGGHDASLVRHGADAGEVVLILDDGTEIQKRITQVGSTLSVRDAEGKQVKGPQGYINRLADALAFDPAAFLRADPKRQAELFLEALPIELDESALLEAVGGVVEVPQGQLRGHPLDILSALHKRIYDERTGVNRAAKEKRATADQLRDSHPIVGGDPAAEIAALEAANEAAIQESIKVRHEINDAAAAETGAATAALDDRIAELQAQLRSLEAERDGVAAKIRARRDEQFRELAAADRVREAETRERLTALRERMKAEAAAANTRKVVATMDAEVASLTEVSGRLTESLQRLDDLKVALLRKTPIKGVEVVDGVIHKDRVPWSRINKAEQVKIAIRLAQLRAGDLKLVCVDELECLDGKTFETFTHHAAKADLQFVVTRVSADPAAAPGLQVTTLAPAGAA